MAILRIKTGSSSWAGVPAIVGPPGPKGDPGPQGAPGSSYILTEQDKADIASQVVVQAPLIVEVDSLTPVITADIGTIYQCGEITSLSFTPCPVGICEIIFTSGATPTELTLSNVKTPAWFDTANLDPNTIYDISVINGTLGAVSKWAT